MRRMANIESTQGSLSQEVQSEGAKFGDDVKYLAEFTAGCKKFEPWIQSSEAKKASGMTKPNNLQEALDQLEDAKKWKSDSETMHNILEESNASALKMTLHDEADAKYKAFIGKWKIIDETAKEWISKLEKMVDVWKKQAETAAKVTAAIAAKPDSQGSEMKLEDLEKHLDALKQMFIEKQKMMEQLDKDSGAGPAPAAAPPVAPAAEPPHEPATAAT